VNRVGAHAIDCTAARVERDSVRNYSAYSWASLREVPNWQEARPISQYYK
jgi:hypothetical protein